MHIDTILNCAVQFPFLGVREDETSFQYLLKSATERQVKISICSWFVNRSFLSPHEVVDLLLPLPYQDEIARTGIFVGKISHVEHIPIVQSVEYDVELDLPKRIPVYDGQSRDALAPAILTATVIALVKKMKFTKSAIRIYLKHLQAYFSRITHHTFKSYSILNHVVLEDMKNHVILNEVKLSELYRHLQANLTEIAQIPREIDLEDLRDTVESEISWSLLGLAFTEEERLQDAALDVLLKNNFSSICMTYLKVIKGLERRLYAKYNKIVQLYAESLSL